MDAIRERLQRLEGLVGEPQTEEPVESLMVHVNDLVAGVTVIQHCHNELMGKSEERFKQLVADLILINDALRKNIKANEEDISVLKKALHSSSSRTEGPSSKFKVPEPKPFSGKRDAKELENFLWDVESYFKATHVPDTEKVSITSIYLPGVTKLRTRVQDDANSGRPRIETWEVLVKELKDQFLLNNTS
ncbi:LOW QUALITY PROTEIN: hypothetical protein CFOL_v3_28594, partial [Cephalotus follicularis]